MAARCCPTARGGASDLPGLCPGLPQLLPRHRGVEVAQIPTLLVLLLQKYFYTEGCWGEQRAGAHDKDTFMSSQNVLQTWAIPSVLSLPSYTFGAL